MSSFPQNFKEWLAKLIAFDTTSRNSNLELITYVEDYLKSVGVHSSRFYNPDKTKANLWAILPAEDGGKQGGIILSGHTDVVPVDGQKWDSDPFQMVEKDGKLYGRGACDMKGFLAVVLALTPTFLKLKRAKPIHYVFSFDEEFGCIGVPYVINHMKQIGFKADGCLIGEPTGMKVFTGNKGFCEWRVFVHGKAIHSSMALMNTSCNAIEYAAQIIAKIREIAIELRETDKRDANYPCPFSPMSTGLLKGGNAVNTVPAECDFMFSVRVADTKVFEDVEARVSKYIEDSIVPSMKEEFAGAAVELRRAANMPAFAAKEEDRLTKHARELCCDKDVRKLGGATEAGYFQETLGIPTVIVGPGPFAIAHQPNEYVSVEDMEASTRFTLDMVKLYTDPQYCLKGNL